MIALDTNILVYAHRAGVLETPFSQALDRGGGRKRRRLVHSVSLHCRIVGGSPFRVLFVGQYRKLRHVDITSDGPEHQGEMRADFR